MGESVVEVSDTRLLRENRPFWWLLTFLFEIRDLSYAAPAPPFLLSSFDLTQGEESYCIEFLRFVLLNLVAVHVLSTRWIRRPSSPTRSRVKSVAFSSSSWPRGITVAAASEAFVMRTRAKS